MGNRDESGYRHGLRVRIGPTGPKGVLLKCERRVGPGSYWKVKLTSGEWVWPDGIVVDGPGAQCYDACLECGLPFMGRPGDVLCRPCDERQFGTEQRAGEYVETQAQRKSRGRYR